MPLYEYECDTCHHRFEVIQRIADPLVEKCPKCGAPVHKLQSAPAIQFKGSGFYITDYAKKDHTDAAKADSAQGAKAEKSGSSEKSEKSERSDKAERTCTAHSLSDPDFVLGDLRGIMMPKRGTRKQRKRDHPWRQ